MSRHHPLQPRRMRLTGRSKQPAHGATFTSNGSRYIVLDSERTTLGAITDTDLAVESWGNRDAYHRHWLARHDANYREALPHATEHECAERFDQRVARVPCLVLTVVPDPTTPPRLLASRSEYGYTGTPMQAMSDEPEAVEEWVQERITERAHQRDQERTHMTRKRLRNDITDLQQRLMAARNAARKEGADRVTMEALRLAEAQLRRAKQAADEVAA